MFFISKNKLKNNFPLEIVKTGAPNDGFLPNALTV